MKWYSFVSCFLAAGSLVHGVIGSLSDWFDAISSILESPLEGCGGFVVLLDVMDQLSG